MLSRRQLLELGAAVTLLPSACRRDESGTGSVVLNDIHSKLNPTRVARLARPEGLDELASLIREAGRQSQVISVSGGRHSMGGQQFASGSLNIDMRSLRRVLSFDAEHGLIEVEAGIEWPELIEWCADGQRSGPRWGIRQKQTGADRLTLGGALASNIHGRGLTYPPIVGDVESLILLGPDGQPTRCSRQENPDLFSLVIGGYGLFGIVYSIVLALAPRRKLERVVEVRTVDGLTEAFERRIAAGFLYGDFQFKTDEAAPDYLQSGVFSCYRPVASDTVVPGSQKRLPRSAWKRLLELAHFNKDRAFKEYSEYYLSTNGQIYWSDEHQLSFYLDDYHQLLDKHSKGEAAGTEMISEVYVPRERLAFFMRDIAKAFRDAQVNVIYGTVRLIEKDIETFLPWARQSWACIVFNLHVRHTRAGIDQAERQFRLLIKQAIEHGGSYFLTYHRWASRNQVRLCHPQLGEFLRRKREWDPEERFQSDWYRHYRTIFATDL